MRFLILKVAEAYTLDASACAPKGGAWQLWKIGGRATPSHPVVMDDHDLVLKSYDFGDPEWDSTREIQIRSLPAQFRCCKCSRGGFTMGDGITMACWNLLTCWLCLLRPHFDGLLAYSHHRSITSKTGWYFCYCDDQLADIVKWLVYDCKDPRVIYRFKGMK